MNTNILLKTRKLVLTIWMMLLSVLGFAVAVGGHFVPAFYPGNGQDHMNLTVISATIGAASLEAGDEIAAFDGNICCGVKILTRAIDPTNFDTFP